MTVRILAFARVREVLGASERALRVPGKARVRDVWTMLAAEHAGLSTLEASTRFARNGRLVSGEEALQDGDEVALLPPVGGG